MKCGRIAGQLIGDSCIPVVLKRDPDFQDASILIQRAVKKPRNPVSENSA